MHHEIVTNFLNKHHFSFFFHIPWQTYTLAGVSTRYEARLWSEIVPDGVDIPTGHRDQDNRRLFWQEKNGNEKQITIFS